MSGGRSQEKRRRPGCAQKWDIQRVLPREGWDAGYRVDARVPGAHLCLSTRDTKCLDAAPTSGRDVLWRRRAEDAR